jgi:hypothetical protein
MGFKCAGDTNFSEYLTKMDGATEYLHLIEEKCVLMQFTTAAPPGLTALKNAHRASS